MSFIWMTQIKIRFISDFRLSYVQYFALFLHFPPSHSFKCLLWWILSHLRYESVFHPKWLICVHMKSFFQHWCVVCVCAVIAVDIDELLPCKLVQKIRSPQISSSTKDLKMYSWIVIMVKQTNKTFASFVAVLCSSINI